LEDIDTSSGALGGAIHRTLAELSARIWGLSSDAQQNMCIE
jgi:hypothetical protein